MARHTLIEAPRRRRPSRSALVMALVWVLLIAGVVAGFHAGGSDCLLLVGEYGTTCG